MDPIPVVIGGDIVIIQPWVVIAFGFSLIVLAATSWVVEKQVRRYRILRKYRKRRKAKKSW